MLVLIEGNIPASKSTVVNGLDGEKFFEPLEDIDYTANIRRRVRATMAAIIKEERSVKTFRVKKSDAYSYMQCDNAYNTERPYCHNTIRDGEEYLRVIRKFDTGDIMVYDFCEGCMRAKLSDGEIESLRGTKKAQTKGDRVEALVNDIRSMLKSYIVNDPTALGAAEAALDEIVRITKRNIKTV